jgi:RNA polymerase sigma-70 factor (ECF subfamily)
VLASTVRVTRDLDLAEEAVQDAYVQALAAWAADGVPAKPGAWLTVAARRNALNVLRRQRTLESKLPLLIVPDSPVESDIPDDRLRLVFTCCHPALAVEAQVALTLRLVCGMATAEVAGVLLVSEPTMAARITRAKKKIALARIPYVVPSAADLPDRVEAALTVIHLLYSAGHTATAGPDLMRDDLAERALDLARMLRLLLPGEPEVAGLLALLLIHHARRSSRADADGRLVRLDEQDRSGWDRAMIAEADRLITAALTAAAPGRFTLQAAIAALHAEAVTYDKTDWAQIVLLYDQLLRIWPSPVVALNRAAAVSMADGPAAALVLVEELERGGRLAAYHYLPATKADLLRRLDRHDEAAAAYAEALALAGNAAEQRFLEARVDELRRPTR